MGNSIDILGLDFVFHIMKTEDKDKLPIYLRELYDICWVEILGRNYIYARLLEPVTKADAMKKHRNAMFKIFSTECIFEIPKITVYKRKKLIESKLAFVVPDKQVFLAYLGINLTDKVNKEIEKYDIEIFSTSSQILFLNLIYNETFQEINPTDAGKILGFTRMTMTRAFNEMESLGLVSSKKIGNKKIYYHSSNYSQMIKKAFEHLKNPVSERLCTDDLGILKNAPISGLQALSEISMINPPSYEIRALKKDDNRLKAVNLCDKEHISEPGFYELELWDYDPSLFKKDGVIDVVSLIACMKEINDDRVQIEIEKLIGEAHNG